MEKYKLCRLCLTQPLVSYSLLDKNGASILESLTSIKISKEDNLPKRACLKCWLNIKLAYQIQQNILEADKKLRSLNFEDETDEIIDTVSSEDDNIKQERFEIIHKSEPDVDHVEADDAPNPEYHSIKVENLTEDEVLIICETDVNKQNLMSLKNRRSLQ
ncbi:hypothetical protein NQ314_009360 [Rhamnusium bicolor]|uniref:ZAD domain-containing protein n=1 Tax=Rhamnusium bicolor TaxID=1586634 RepID=A0AAV8Y0I9_9CUCU|nr:hypothetical protein NQ314_009360 [Rhamnusium bicolor]